MRKALIGVGVGAIVAGAALFFGLRSGTVYLSGTHAGDLTTGDIGVGVSMKRGQSFTIGDDSIHNVGKQPVLVESIEPQSSSPSLRATVVRLWLAPLHGHLGLAGTAPGWPPTHPPTKPPKWAPNWVQPHPNYASLPTSLVIPPGRNAQIEFGIFLRSDPSPQTRITGLRVTFVEGGRKFIWLLPETVDLQKANR